MAIKRIATSVVVARKGRVSVSEHMATTCLVKKMRRALSFYVILGSLRRRKKREGFLSK